MRCPRCHSTDLVQIGPLIYCRHCVSFGQIRPQSKPSSIPVLKASDDVHYALNYVLSTEQKRIAEEIQYAVSSGQHVLIQAVCGSGKTELVYPAICQALAQKKVVGFSLPRKDLAIEIYDRLKSQLQGVKMTLVYGGHHEDCFQALVVCTTHQLYRYWQYFDLLIIDESDAFPFYDNALLNSLAISACKGRMILMSATTEVVNLPSQFIKFELNRRYHDHDLPLPCLKRSPDGLFVLLIYRTLKRIVKNKGLCLIFVPVKKDLKLLVLQLRFLGFKVNSVSSASSNPQSILTAFRKHQIEVLVTTTLLERGVTFENVHVFVYRAHHRVFTRATLIQICGRVGRKPNYPSGEIYLVGKRITKEMKACLKHLQAKNAA